jgi:drug/metabolite transporter (DMT)-like permease
LGLAYEGEWMDLYFLYFILFSFILIALILFLVFFKDELKEMKRHFKWKQYIIYLLGSLCILVSISLSYLLYFMGYMGLAISIFVVFNASAVYFLYQASTIAVEKDWKE